MICVRLDMLDFQHLAIDGQRIKANANYRRSKNQQRTRQSYKRVKEAIERVICKPMSEDFTEAKKAQRLEKLETQRKGWSSPDFVDTLNCTCVSVSGGIQTPPALRKRNHGPLRAKFLLHSDLNCSSSRLPFLKLLIFRRREVAKV